MSREAEERHGRLIYQVSFLVGWFEGGDVPVELLSVALDDGDVPQAVRDRVGTSRARTA